MAHDIWKVPNLISLGRLLLLIPVGYFLSRPEPHATLYALAFLVAAEISDYLDGFFARLLNQRTKLGLILDPLSDKVLAAVMIVLLLLYRNFPLWMAAVIVGRDLIIGLGGLMYSSKIEAVPSSNFTGKYTFASIAVLIVSYVIEFEFGIRLLTVIVVPLCALSLVLYIRAVSRVMKGRPAPKFRDRRAYRLMRVSITVAISVVYIYELFKMIGWI